MGASFDHGEDGNLHLMREGGHSHRRIVHAADMTGKEIERALLNAVVNNPNIFMFEHHFAIDLLTCQVCSLESFISFLLVYQRFCSIYSVSSVQACSLFFCLLTSCIDDIFESLNIDVFIRFVLSLSS